MVEDSEDSDCIQQAVAAASEAKEAGNAALKSADLPHAIEKYEEALKTIDEAIPKAPQPQVLRQNDCVTYSPGRFADVDYVLPAGFGEYRLKDLYSNDMVMQKMGYEDVVVDFKRKDVTLVPKELFDLRLACMQNLTLVKMKLARASQREADYEEVALQADRALAMDGRSPKALMRKGAACLELKYYEQAAMMLKLAATLTKWKDPEVVRLLELAQSKGIPKGKGKGQAVKHNNFKLRPELCQPCSSCDEPGCQNPEHVMNDMKDGSSDSDSGTPTKEVICPPAKAYEEEQPKVNVGVSRTHDDDEDSDEDEIPRQRPRPRMEEQPKADSSSGRRIGREEGTRSQRQEVAWQRKDESDGSTWPLLVALVFVLLAIAGSLWYIYSADTVQRDFDADEL